jgi:hypothetical protein
LPTNVEPAHVLIIRFLKVGEAEFLVRKSTKLVTLNAFFNLIEAEQHEEGKLRICCCWVERNISWRWKFLK